MGTQDDADSPRRDRGAVGAASIGLDTAPMYGSGLSEKICGERAEENSRRAPPAGLHKFDSATTAFPKSRATREQVLSEC